MLNFELRCCRAGNTGRHRGLRECRHWRSGRQQASSDGDGRTQVSLLLRTVVLHHCGVVRQRRDHRCVVRPRVHPPLQAGLSQAAGRDDDARRYPRRKRTDQSLVQRQPGGRRPLRFAGHARVPTGRRRRRIRRHVLAAGWKLLHRVWRRRRRCNDSAAPGTFRRRRLRRLAA